MSGGSLVSVIMIFLDEERFIEEAIGSVFAQSYGNWELLLVDDGSSDGSTEIALRYAERYPGKVRYLEHPGHRNRGMSASRNLGIRHARGEYIAFLDADDVWLARNLEQQVTTLSAHPEAGMVYGNTQYWYSWTGDPRDAQRDFVPDLGVKANAVFEPPTLLEYLLQDGNTVPCMCSIVVRRKSTEEIGEFEENFRGLYEDQAFYVKVCLKAPVLAVDERRAKYRQHEGASSSIALRTADFDPVKPNPARHRFLEWVAAYLTEHGVENTEVWRVLQQELQPYTHPGAPIDVVEVALAEADGGRLWGRNIEAPQPGLRTDGHELDLAGWVVGRHSPAVAVEVVHGGTVVRRAPVSVRRPDVASAFPEVQAAQRSGFHTRVGMAGMGELELGVQAVLRDQSRVPLGTIRVRRRWREGDYEVGAALVSVVIPCHDQAHFLGEAIESVLAQTYPHFEVVVVDDGSTDNTEEVASRYPGVRCVRQENRGLAAARNTGIRRSNGGHLVFLDADDRLLPGALEAGLRCFRDHPESAFVAGRYRYVAFDGSPLPTPQPPRPESDHFAALLRNCYISTLAAAMWQRMVLEHLGVFDTSVCFSSDRDLYLRVAKQYPVHHHGEVVAEYRKPDTSMTYEAASMLESEVTVLRRQRKYTSSRERYKEAYNLGIRHSQDSFGKPLIEESLVYLQEQQWRSAISALLVLIRYHPRGFASVLRSKLSRTGV